MMLGSDAAVIHIVFFLMFFVLLFCLVSYTLLCTISSIPKLFFIFINLFCWKVILVTLFCDDS